ncbi:MAG: DUF2063 domain-containing protein [Sphingomonas sp.]|nr:MAG: DUF2063 domain-containing protein [Sphingomonas sp.]
MPSPAPPPRGGFACGPAEQQARFARALLDPQAPVPAGLVDPHGRPSAKRFAVYRNNVIVGLIEALKAAYPVVHRLVGSEFFTEMARLHAMAEPPVSPLMLDYGAGFPGFIASFEPAAMLPYLTDVARLERAWVEAYHAAEASPLAPYALGNVPPADVPTLRLLLHPSLRIVRSGFPIMAIWHANVDRSFAGAIDLDDGGDDVLVARPEAEVELRRLPPGAVDFIQALQSDFPILDAAGEGLRANPHFDISSMLQGMIEARLIVRAIHAARTE